MANTVNNFTDGVGYLVHAIQWDGDLVGTWANIHAWTKRANLDKRGVLGIQDHLVRRHVGVNDWLVMDSSKNDQVFPMTNPQFTATYKPAAGNI